MIFLNSSFSCVKDPTSFPPFLEQMFILLAVISQKWELSMSARK